jgi:SNF2 family DNA or RNA helicase
MGKYEFKNEPWAHQRECLTLSWNKTYFHLGMEYGTGKSFVIVNNAGILYELERIQALMIIAPNEVHEQWVDEQIPTHLPERIKYIARVWSGDNTKKFKQSLEELWYFRNKEKLKIFSINVESLQSSTRAQNFCKNFLSAFPSLLTVDESTRIKTPNSNRTKFIINHLAKLAKYRRTLSGNEITRSPFDVYSPYRFLEKNFWHPLPNFFAFKHRYAEYKTNFVYRKSCKVKMVCPDCGQPIEQVEIKRLGATFAICPLCTVVLKVDTLPHNAKKLIESEGKFEYPTLIKYKNLEELRNRTAVCSYIVRKKDCMDLPEKILQPIYTKMNDEQNRVYYELKNQMITEYEGVELSVPNKIALSVRFQQIVGGFFPESGEQIGKNNPKIDRLLYDLEDIDTDAPIIIWSRFIIEIKKIAERLKKEYDGNVVTFFGETAKEDRKNIIKDFKDGKVQFFIANTDVGGTGLNLQKSYIQYFYSNSFKAENRWQAEDRSHRGGQTHDCLYKDIFIKGTIDDTVKKSNDEKKNFTEFFKNKRVEDIV